MDSYDVIIVGAGAAGLSAGLYCGRYKMRTLIVDKEFGGETGKAGIIWNYPGAKEIDGYDLVKTIRDQSKDVGAEFVDGIATKIEKRGECFFVTVKDKEYQGDTIIFAVGTERRHLNIPNEKELTGHGVHYCVTCDGPLYGGKTIAMVGGGDASVKGVNLASEYVDKVYLIVMDKKLIAEPINEEQMIKLGNKVEVLYETQVKEIVGKEKLEKIILDKEHNGSNELIIDGLFIEIGAVPQVALAKSLGVALDERGYIQVDNSMKTNIEGVYAAGDTTNFFGSFKQDITAAAQGAVAATSSYNYNQIHGDPCSIHAKPHIKEEN